MGQLISSLANRNCSTMPGPRAFTLSELIEYTGDFKKFIGRGGFSEVFEGDISNMKVAVKVSRCINPIIRTQFQAEVEYLPRMEHQNIIKLVGYCETEERFYLVYPFMPNGNVQSKLSELDWNKTTKMLRGVASAIQELHSHTPPLIYRDLKPDNILLDMDFNPKLADFGTVTVEGECLRYCTRGYTDPIVMNNDGEGRKLNDVYSFGVVMLQIMMKENFVSLGGNECRKHITEWKIAERSIDGHLVHHKLLGKKGCSLEAAIEITNLAFLCVAKNPELRPTMAQVLHRLSLLDGSYRDGAIKFREWRNIKNV